jgi:glycosyltransferase involved in cell wall biosynthesis
MLAYTFYEGDNRVMRYAETLVERGDEVDVIALRKEGQLKKEIINGVNVHRIQKRIKNEKGPLTYLYRILGFFVRAFFVLSISHFRKGYRLLHVHSVPDFLVFAAFVPRVMGAKIVLDIHDLLPELYVSKFAKGPDSKIFRLLVHVERISARFADHIIVANHIWQQRLISRSVPAEKCSVFLNYPDLSIFRRHGRTRSDAKFIMLYPGTLAWHQGLDIAIHAFAKLKNVVPNLEFHIYGEGSAREDLIQLTQTLGIHDRVLFHDAIPLREIPLVIENADLGIVPKRKDFFGNEAFSTKTLEFMTLGVPIIVADTAVDQYYFNDQVVTFFAGGDADHLAACILELAQNPRRRQKQVEYATRFVQHHAWTRVKGEYVGLLDALTASDRSRLELKARNSRS